MRTFSLLTLLTLSILSLTAQEQPRDGMSLSEFRSLRSSSQVGKLFYLSDGGKQGLFVRDPADRNSADDSVMKLRTADGVLFRRIADQGLLNVKWFGATGNGATDDWYAIQKGISYILNSPAADRTLYFPPGDYRISRPLLIARPAGNTYRQASINLAGPANSKDLGMGAANILPLFNNTFAIGIQSGKGVQIRDLVIRGQFTFPNRLQPVQVDTLRFDQWTDGSTRDNQRSPYAGIVIDPFSDAAAYPSAADMYPGLHDYYLRGLGRGGSTAVQITGCSITNFIVGVMITPSNQQNGELIDVIDCDISDNKVGYAMGQAQSKECHVERLKCWGPTHTLFDNVHYGFGHGDGAAVPLVDGVNIAYAVKELCCIYARSFGGVFRNVYAEELFRIGYAGGDATVSFEDCQFNFATESPGKPYPDYFVYGSGISFRNCMLRCYTGKRGMRLILSGSPTDFVGGVMNEPPVAANLEPNGIYASPQFRNVLMYYSGGILGSGKTTKTALSSPFWGSNGRDPDPVYPGNTYLFRDPDAIAVNYKLTYQDTYERTVHLWGTPTLHVNLSDWTGWFRLESPAESALLQPGDFILTYHRPYQDMWYDQLAPTSPVGFIKRIGHDTVYLANLAIGIREGMKLELWMDYYVNTSAPFIGDIAAGSNVITRVQGAFPGVGERPDIPMLPAGAYVTAVDPHTGTIRFSASNVTHRSHSDYTFMNGFPTVEMFSSYSPDSLQLYGKTLIGGALFYRQDADQVSPYERSLLPDGTTSLPYKILSTNLRGDTSLHKMRFISPRPASR